MWARQRHCLRGANGVRRAKANHTFFPFASCCVAPMGAFAAGAVGSIVVSDFGLRKRKKWGARLSARGKLGCHLCASGHAPISLTDFPPSPGVQCVKNATQEAANVGGSFRCQEGAECGKRALLFAREGGGGLWNLPLAIGADHRLVVGRSLHAGQSRRGSDWGWQHPFFCVLTEVPGSVTFSGGAEWGRSVVRVLPGWSCSPRK